MNVDDARVFQTTLERLRQRYALHYNASDTAGRNVEIQLASAAARRHPNAEIRFRRVSQFDDAGGGDVQVSRSRPPARQPADNADATPEPRLSRRRPAVNEPQGDRGATMGENAGGWRRADEPSTSTKAPTAAPPAKSDTNQQQPRRGGWRKLEPGEQP
jgi:hypothetical protein